MINHTAKRRWPLFALSLCLLFNACSLQPSEKTIQSSITQLIRMEGGQDIHFDQFQIEEIKQNANNSAVLSYRVRVKLAGTFRQIPRPEEDFTYEFNTVRSYEFYRSGRKWKTYVVGLTPLYQDAGTHRIDPRQPKKAYSQL